MRATGPFSRPLLSRFARACFVTLAVLLPKIGYAQATFVWDGGGNPTYNWSLGSNWVSGTPAAGTSANYHFSGAGVTATADGATAWSVNNLTFLAAATSAFTVASPTTLNVGAGGIVQADAANHIISAPMSLQSTVTVSGAGAGTLTFSGPISGYFGNGLTKSMTADLTLSGTSANTYLGMTTITGGTLNLNKSSGVVAVAGNIIIGDGVGVDTLRTQAIGQIASTSALTFAAGGTPTFNLNNFAQSVGSVQSANINAAITLGSATLTVGGDNMSTTFAGTISGTGGLTKTGTSTLTLTGSNSYSGNTTINQGTLSITAESALGNPTAHNAARLTLNGGTLAAGGTLTLSDAERGITFGAGGGTLEVTNSAHTLTVSQSGAATLNGSGAFNKTGAGTLILSGTTATAHTGAVNVNEGTLQIAKTGAANQGLGDSSAVTVNGTLSFNTGTSGETIGSLAGAGVVHNAHANAMTLTTGGANTSTTFSGVMHDDTGGALSLTKAGSGTFTLSNANTYTGTTSVTGGTLQLGHVAALGPAGAAVTLGAGTTLALASDQATNGYNTTLSGSATVTSGRANTGDGITHTLGTLAIGAQTLSVTAGPNVNNNTAYGLGFGATTFSASGAVFDVANNGSGTGTLTLGALAGNFNFTKQGAGILSLDSASARSGGTATLNGGTLRLGNTAALGTTGATLTLTSGTLSLATDTSANAYNVTVNGSSTIASGRDTAGHGITHTLGTLSIGAQTLSVTAGNNVANNTAYGLTFGTTTLTGGATFDVGNNGTGIGTLTLGAVGGGANSLTKTGAGVLALGAASTYTGGTNVNGGTVKFGVDNALSSTGAVSIGASGILDLTSYNASIGALSGSGIIDLSTNSVNRTLTVTQSTNTAFSGVIQDSGTGSALSLTKADTGTLTLSGANTYAGTTTINGGTLAFGVDNTLPTTGAVVMGGGTLDLVTYNGTIGTLSGSGTVNLSGSSVNRSLTINDTSSATYSGTFTDTGGSSNLSVIKAGTGTLTLSGASSHTGGMTLNAGTLNINNSAALGTGTFTIAGGTIDSTTAGITLGSVAQNWNSNVTFTGTNSLDLGTGAVTLNANRAITIAANTLTVGGGITDGASSFGLTKAGGGTLVLTGASTYNGTTTIKQGTLMLDGANGALNTSAATNIVLMPGGTLALDNAGNNNTDRIHNSTTLTANGGTINFTHAGGAGAFSESVGAITIASGGLDINLTQAVGGTSNITVSSMSRSAGGTVTFNGTGLGVDAQNQFIFTTAPAETNNIISWAVHKNGSAINLAKQDGNATSISAFSAYTTTANNTWGGSGNFTVNAKPSASQTGINGNRWLNALVLDNAIDLRSNNTSDRTINFGNATAGGAGTILQTSGTSTINNNGNGGITLAFGATEAKIFTFGTLTLNRANDGTNSITGTAGITKDGTGTFINRTTNANTGLLTINDGTWRAETQVGAVSGGGVVLNKGTLALASNAGTTFTNTNTAVNGNATVTIDRTTAAATATTHTLGTLTMNNGSTLSVTAGSFINAGTAYGLIFQTSATLGGTDTVFGFDVANNGAGLGTLTLRGLTGGATARTINKTGAGALTLDTTGGTLADGSIFNLNAGTANLNVAGALGSLTQVNLAASTTLSLGAAQTFGSLAGTGAVSHAANTLTVGNATNNLSSTFSGTLTGSGSLVKAGNGTLALAGNNAGLFTGAVSVNAGTLKLQHADALGTGTLGTTVADGATLQIDGHLDAGNGLLTITGNNTAATTALVGSGGNNRWQGDITFNGNATVSTSGSGYLALGTTSPTVTRPLGVSPPVDTTTLTLNGKTLTFNGTTSASDNRAIYVNARIVDGSGGAGNIVIDMERGFVSDANPGDMVRYTAYYNPYTGSTTIKNGTLSLATLTNTYPGDMTAGNSNFFGINGSIFIGDGSGAAKSSRLHIQSGAEFMELINYNSAMTIKEDGLFHLLNRQSIGALTFHGGRVDLGTEGILFLNGDVTVNTSTQTAVIDGSGGTSALSLKVQQGPSPNYEVSRAFDVVGGSGLLSDLSIGVQINHGSIVKNGAGTMTITSDNTLGYQGTTTINAGTLSIQHSKALGLTSHPTTGVDGARTIVNTGGTLQLSNVANGNLTVSGEKLSLDGGTLQSLAGNNTWGGSAGIVLESSSTIKSDADLFTVSTTLTSSSGTLTVTGSGNTKISGDIGTNSGGIEKNGSGTLILAGNNNFNGVTNVNTGIVSVQSNTALGTTTGATTVIAGAALHLDNTHAGGGTAFVSTSSETLNLNGTGTNGTGAFHSVSGHNIFGGTVNLQAPSTLTAASGASLTMRGLDGVQALTIGNSNHAGTVKLTPTVGSVSGTVGQTDIAAGTFHVGEAGTTSLTTAELTSATSTTLIVGSGGTVNSVFDNGTISNFDGVIGSTSTGTLALSSITGSSSGLKFGTTFTSTGLTLKVGGTTLGSSNAADYFTLQLGANVNITVGTLHITGDTILDFGNSTATQLSSTFLKIDPNVKITVVNWVSGVDFWKVTTESSGITNGVGGNAVSLPPTQYGTGVLPQITFANYNGLTTTWVSGTGGGWTNHEIRPTPEPGTYGAIFISGCLGLLGWRRYRNQRIARK